MKKVSNNILTRTYVLFALFMVFSLFILVRVMVVQVKKDQWVKQELEQKVFFKKVVADRGNILSENGAIMATSLPFYRIAIDPTMVDTTQYIGYSDSLLVLATKLAETFGGEEKDSTLHLLHYNRIIDGLANGKRHVYLTRKLLSHRQLQEVKTWPIIRRGQYKGGFKYEKLHNKRHYPFGELAKVTLGSLSHDTVGIRGIEAAFNRELRGRDGFILAQKIRGDSYIPLDQYGDDDALDGLDITTTLDVDLQDIVEQALKKGVEKNLAKSGTAILMDVKTGKIKALANYPEDYNHAVAKRIEPGSTFKLASFVAMLNDTIMGPCDSIDTENGKIQFDDKEISDDYRLGKISMEKAFYKSSNVFTARAIYEAYKDQPEKYLAHLEKFGLTQAANNQLIGEPEPVVHRPGDKAWNMATLPSMSIGYSILVTPLQMASFYNAIANNGKRMRPWLVKEIRNNSDVIRQFGPEVMEEEICDGETLRIIREMMMQVVESGTARNIKGTPFRIAGKTGTAKKIKNRRYVRKYLASFGGFFPAGRPQYSLYIVVDEPSNGLKYGGDVAAPIFKEIAERVYTFDWKMSTPATKKNTRPIRKPAPRVIYAQHAQKVFGDLGIETSMMPKQENSDEEIKWVKTNNNGHQINYVEMPVSKDRIPNVKGMSSRDAMNLLEKLGIQVNLRGFGKVKRQSLLPGYRIGKNTQIVLYLG